MKALINADDLHKALEEDNIRDLNKYCSLIMKPELITILEMIPEKYLYDF
jgi:hypothetical protein